MRGFNISAHNIDFASMELVAARRFTLDGKDYDDGDVLPEGALPERRARQMFERRMIKLRARVAEEAPAAGPEAVVPLKRDENGGLDVDEKPAPKAKGGRKGKAKAETPAAAPEAPTQPHEEPQAADTTAAEEKPASGADSAPQGGAVEITKENGYRAEHEAFGRWYVFGPDGAKVSGPHKRPQIEHLIG